MKAIKTFEDEIQKWDTFFRGTIFAYDETIRHFRNEVEAGIRDGDEIVTHSFPSGYPHDLVATSSTNLRHRFKKVYPPYLCDLLLVKLISILEVFFSDVTREVLASRRDILKQVYFRRGKESSNSSVPKFSTFQLLSLNSFVDVENKLIDYESRTIANKSFVRLEKYFRDSLRIDFRRFDGDKEMLEKAYHTRNLLVHRLGKTDLDYRLSNKTTQTKVSVSRGFLLKLVTLVQAFADFISSEVSLLVSRQEQPSIHNIVTCVATIVVEPLSSKGQRALQRDFRFTYNDRLYLLGEFLYSYSTDENLSVIKVNGKVKEINAYLKTLKMFKRSGDVRIVAVHFERYVGKNKSRFPGDFLQEVAQALPNPPYSESQIDELANVLAMKRRNAKRLIDLVETWKNTSEATLAAVKEVLQRIPLQKDIHKLVARELEIDDGLSYKLIGFTMHSQFEKSVEPKTYRPELPFNNAQ